MVIDGNSTNRAAIAELARELESYRGGWVLSKATFNDDAGEDSNAPAFNPNPPASGAPTKPSTIAGGVQDPVLSPPAFGSAGSAGTGRVLSPGPQSSQGPLVPPVSSGSPVANPDGTVFVSGAGPNLPGGGVRPGAPQRPGFSPPERVVTPPAATTGFETSPPAVALEPPLLEVEPPSLALEPTLTPPAVLTPPATLTPPSVLAPPATLTPPSVLAPPVSPSVTTPPVYGGSSTLSPSAFAGATAPDTSTSGATAAAPLGASHTPGGDLDYVTLLKLTRALGDCSVQFNPGDKAITAESIVPMQRAVDIISKLSSDFQVGLRPQVGRSGDAAARLGAERADVVRKVLMEFGVPAERLQIRETRYLSGLEDRLDFEVSAK